MDIIMIVNKTYIIGDSELQHPQSGHSCVLQYLHEDNQSALTHSQCSEHHQEGLIQYHQQMCK